MSDGLSEIALEVNRERELNEAARLCSETIASYPHRSAIPYPAALQDVLTREGGATNLSPEQPEAVTVTGARDGRV